MAKLETPVLNRERWLLPLNNTHMETPEHIWFLMSRNLSGEASPAEQQELFEQLQSRPVLLQQYEMMRRMWQGEAGLQQEPEPAETARVDRILRLSAAEVALQNEPTQHISPVRHVHRWKKITARAAIVAGLALGAWAWMHWQAGRTGAANEIVAKRGSKTRTILPDGSTVWLNAGSSIQYAPGFSGPLREVTLQGEAFFDVVKMPSRPFIVHAGDLRIKVLGTAFDVKSYEEDTTVETTLIRGLVQITRADDKRQAPIYLHPHQKVVLPRKDTDAPGALAATPADPAMPAGRPALIVAIDSSMKEDVRVETSWVYNRLEFRGDRFDDLARRLERWYNITIHFEDDAARGLTFNGSLENETVEQAFLALAAAVPFRFKIKDDEIYISSVKPPVPGVTPR